MLHDVFFSANPPGREEKGRWLYEELHGTLLDARDDVRDFHVQRRRRRDDDLIAGDSAATRN